MLTKAAQKQEVRIVFVKSVLTIKVGDVLPLPMNMQVITLHF